MKVYELIQRLQEFPQESEVRFLLEDMRGEPDTFSLQWMCANDYEDTVFISYTSDELHLIAEFNGREEQK